jgi:hypothetical protein
VNHHLFLEISHARKNSAPFQSFSRRCDRSHRGRKRFRDAFATLSIESLPARQLNLRIKVEQVKRLDEAEVRALSLPPHVERALTVDPAVLRTPRDEITSLEAVLHQEAQLRPKFEILKRVPEQKSAVSSSSPSVVPGR